MTGPFILIAILVISTCGLTSAADGPSADVQAWWPTQPPWWPSHWPTWPTKPTTTPQPSTCVNYWKYPYPSDCSKFQLCLSGTLFTLPCPLNLHFHDEIQECNLPFLAKCVVTTDGPTTTEEGTTTTEVITTETEDVTTTTEDGTTITEDVEGLCEDYRKYPYPEDCTKYLQCLKGTLHLLNCPKTLHYHDEIQNCNRPEMAQCDVITDVPTTTTEEVTTTTEEVITTTTEEMRTTTDDEEVTTTQSPITTPTTPTTTTKPPSPGGVNCSLGDYHPHPTDCNKYYHCSNGVPYLRPCPAGLHWNTKVLTCDWPNAAGCIAG